ncbi:G-protein coupled receptor Mth2-like [Cloeon dipterum]|uniref:G-protein coupled receptor Mth2-like n=1 Tax=Cloeon dipterum TaxID=197152 RepID=UPI0032206D5F
MKSSIFTLVLIPGLALGKDFCKEELRTSVEDAVLLKNGTLMTGKGDNYPEGTFWKDEAEAGHWWVCPCLLGNCIRICDKEFAEVIIEDSSGSKPVTHFLWNEIIETDTPPIEFFKQIRHAKCDGVSNILKKEDVRILSSGKMRLKDKMKLYDAEDYCVHQMEGRNSIYIVHCAEEEFEHGFEGEQFPVEYHIYLYISQLSSIFLILTVLAYILSPQIESFHRKCVIFYAANHAAYFSAMTVNIYFFGKELVKSRCFFIGYIGFYSHLASMFWLNIMCINIFFTYKGVLRKGRNYFALFAAYSICAPIPIVAVALIFNLIDNDISIFNPKMGKNGICWMNNIDAEWIYGFGPSLILLVANVCWLSATCCARGEPVRTSEETDLTVPQEKERRRTYLMLTLVVCLTFIVEAIPYFIGGARIITLVVGVFSTARGVLIFLLLVCADKYVRKSLSSRFCKAQRGYII